MNESTPAHREEGFRASKRMRLTIWAGADKALPMVYGAFIALVLVLQLLPREEFGVWTVFQMLFLIISQLGDWFLLQPMVKLCAEHEADERPYITAAGILYTAFSLILAAPVILFPEAFAALFKSPHEGVVAFSWVLVTVAATIVRNIAIRILQITYRIAQIFVVDLAYFGGFVVFLLIAVAGRRELTALDLVSYNLIALAASSVVGAAICFRYLIPSFAHFGVSTRRIIELGSHQGGTGLMTIAQQNADIAIVSGTRGVVAAAIYQFARLFYRVFEAIREAGQLLLVPVTSNAWSQRNKGKVEDITVLATAILVALLYPLSIGLILVAPFIIPLVPEYASAVDEFQWLMAGGFPMPFVIVPSAVLLGIGHTRDLFRGMFVGTVVFVLGGLILTYVFGSAGMAAGVLLGVSTTAIVLTKAMNRYVDFTFRTVIRRSRRFGPLLRARIRDARAAFGRGRSGGM